MKIRYSLPVSYGLSIDAWIQAVFAAWEDSEEFYRMDNLRVAREGDYPAMDRYEEQ